VGVGGGVYECVCVSVCVCMSVCVCVWVFAGARACEQVHPHRQTNTRTQKSKPADALFLAKDVLKYHIHKASAQDDKYNSPYRTSVWIGNAFYVAVCAVCCSVLQRVAVCYSVLQCATVCCTCSSITCTKSR